TEPGYYELYRARAMWLEAVGEPGDWERSPDETATKYLPAEGMSVYTRIAWSLSTDYQNVFQQTRIDWNKMRQGCRDIETRWPNSL
ncbi:MAG TPA: hypothetical protein VGQ82_11515, partial [Chthoniobacterales bacterium]|nr:hypothetical protein [Chthoniobacterales bacterium]